MALKLMKLRDPSELPLPPLQEHPKYRAAAEELAALERRFAESEQRKRVSEARIRGQRPTPSVTARAKALLAGGQIAGSSPQGELEAAIEEMTVLHQAIVAQREKLAAIAGEISFEVCKRFAPLMAESLRAALEAVTTLHESLEMGRVLRARLIANGYLINTSALPVHLFPQAAQLGSPDAIGMTPAAMFKSWLAQKGII